MSKSLARLWIATVTALLALPAHADAPAPLPQDFAWRATLDVPAGASLARVALPASALARLQASDARDVRIFNGAGEAVAFSFVPNPAQTAPPPSITTAYNALPLFSASAGAPGKPGKGAMRVRIEGGQRSVWVQIDGQAPAAAGAARLNSVIFDTRAQKQALSALRVQATLPANAPVGMQVSTSADLAQWSPQTVTGRLYRFDSAGAPTNDVLEFERPVSLENRYLRLDWTGQDGVNVSAVTGVVASALPPPVRLGVDLPAPQAQGKGLEFRLPFATPIATLVLATPQPNTLLPVRILGRKEASQPWLPLTQTVVYRLGAAGSESANTGVPLHASVRWLRIESAGSTDLSDTQLQARAEFDPIPLVFVATGQAPFQIAAGRAATAPAALPLNVLAAALGERKVESLPQARIGAEATPTAAAPKTGWLAQLRPEGVSDRTVLLWAVLLGGVLLLGGVAWSLMRQLKAQPAAEEQS